MSSSSATFRAPHTPAPARELRGIERWGRDVAFTQGLLSVVVLCTLYRWPAGLWGVYRDHAMTATFLLRAFCHAAAIQAAGVALILLGLRATGAGRALTVMAVAACAASLAGIATWVQMLLIYGEPYGIALPTWVAHRCAEDAIPAVVAAAGAWVVWRWRRRERGGS